MNFFTLKSHFAAAKSKSFLGIKSTSKFLIVLDERVDFKMQNLCSGKFASRTAFLPSLDPHTFIWRGKVAANYLYVVFHQTAYKFDFLGGSPVLVSRIWSRAGRLTLREFSVDLQSKKLLVRHNPPIEHQLQAQYAFHRKCLELPPPEPPSFKLRVNSVSNCRLCSSHIVVEPESRSLFALARITEAADYHRTRQGLVLDLTVEHDGLKQNACLAVAPMHEDTKFNRVLRYVLVRLDLESRALECQLITSPFFFYSFKARGAQLHFEIQSFGNSLATLASATRSLSTNDDSGELGTENSQVYSGTATLQQRLSCASQKFELQFPDPDGVLCKITRESNRQSSRSVCFRGSHRHSTATGSMRAS